MLEAYLENANLASWGRRALFVLLGDADDASEVKSQAPWLWTVAAVDLAQVVDAQGRGTINAHTLDSLVDAGLALDLATRIGTINLQDADDGSQRRSAAPQMRTDFWFAYRFGLNRPTPLGVAVDGRNKVAFVS
jgi:hypothetical protein